MSLKRGMVLGILLLSFSLSVSLFSGHWGADQPLRADASDSLPIANLESKPKAQAPAVNMRVVGFGHVDIEEGTTPLSVPAIGQIAEVLVQDGDEVQAGDPLVRLRSESALAQLQRAQAAVTEAEIRLSQARRSPENHRILLDRQRQAIAAGKSRLDGHRRQVERLEKLNQSNAVSSENFLSAKDKLDELEAALKADELQLAQLELDDPQEGIKMAEAALEAAKAQRTMVEDELSRRTLTAPEAGIVLRVLVTKGQSIGPNNQNPAIWFCPDRPRIVRCEIDQEFAHLVSVGMRASLYDDRQAEKEWSGVVSRCADWIAPRRSMLDEPFQKNDVRTLECIVTLDAPPRSGEGDIASEPRIGQRLRVELFDIPSSTLPASDADQVVAPSAPLSQTRAQP